MEAGAQANPLVLTESDEEDIELVKEVGLVNKPVADLCLDASVDFPHPRNLCAVFPFSKLEINTNARYCNRCYCFVCDIPAHQCKEWMKGDHVIARESHCHAHCNKIWSKKRSMRKMALDTCQSLRCKSQTLNSQTTSLDQPRPILCPLQTAINPHLDGVLLSHSKSKDSKNGDCGRSCSSPVEYANKRHKPLPIVEQLQIPVGDDPAMNKQLALLGTVILSCKTTLHNLENHLVPYGFKDAMSEAQIFQLCYDHNLVSLWNLHKTLEFVENEDQLNLGMPLEPMVFDVLAELRRNSLPPFLHDSRHAEHEPARMYTVLNWCPGPVILEGEMSIKVYVWKIGFNNSLLGDINTAWASSQDISNVLKWLSCFGQSEMEESTPSTIHRQMYYWYSRREKLDLSEASIRKSAYTMSYKVITAHETEEQIAELCTPLMTNQVHAIGKMHEAESKALGFVDKTWVKLYVEDRLFWYSPFLDQLAMTSPSPQCRGGLLVELTEASMRLIVLGLIVLHPAPIETKHLLAMGNCYRATLIVCSSMRKTAWMSSRSHASKPLGFLEYSDTYQFWLNVDQCDVVVATYSDVFKQFNNNQHYSQQRLFHRPWYRLIFADGGIFNGMGIPMVPACEALGSMRRWILTTSPITANLYSLFEKFRLLRVQPWNDDSHFREMASQLWRPFYLVSQYIVRHEVIV